MGSVSNIVHLGELTAASTAPFNFRLKKLKPVLSWTGFVLNRFCLEPVLSGNGFVWKRFYLELIWSGTGFVWNQFCLESVMSGTGFVLNRFCLEKVLSGAGFVWNRFCLEQVLSGTGTGIALSRLKHNFKNNCLIPPSSNKFPSWKWNFVFVHPEPERPKWVHIHQNLRSLLKKYNIYIYISHFKATAKSALPIVWQSTAAYCIGVN